MAVEIVSAVIRENQLEVTLEGEADGRSYPRILSEVFASAESHQVNRVLLDASHVAYGNVSILFEHQFALFLARESPFTIQLAVVAPIGDKTNLGYFQLAAQNRGVCINVVQGRDEAIEWFTR